MFRQFIWFIPLRCVFGIGLDNPTPHYETIDFDTETGLVYFEIIFFQLI